jgi:YebC/PmpR family DNA-binding regulatory protein
MSGHSKWATTKHKKAIVDAKRGKMFAKMVKNIEVAARMGGPDLDGNPTLYDAVQKARKASVPKDHIDRAVKRGGGVGEDAVDYITIMYEGYAPGGVALLVECLTDNRNRAAMEVRTAMTRNGGTMADPGSVSYMFHRKGVIMVPQEQEGGPTNDLDGSFEVVCEATDLVAVRTALQEAGLDYDSADASFVPTMTVEVDVEAATKIMRLIDALEDSDDVQNVFANFDASDEVMAQVE